MDDITARELVSACCLSLVAVLATVAVFCRDYHENWPQFVGLVGIAVWSAARVSQLTDMTSTRLPAQAMVLHISMACYALGTAWKVWLHSHGPHLRPPPPYQIEPEHQRQVAGGNETLK